MRSTRSDAGMLFADAETCKLRCQVSYAKKMCKVSLPVLTSLYSIAYLSVIYQTTAIATLKALIYLHIVHQYKSMKYITKVLNGNQKFSAKHVLQIFNDQGRHLYIFIVFTEYPLNLSSSCISMFSINLTFDKILMMQFC